MNGPERLSFAIGVGFIVFGCLVGFSAVRRRRALKRKLSSGKLDYWERVFTLEAAANAMGDLFLAGFAFLMGALFLGMGLSGILLS